jgi:cation diffusion facilitator CzcD-associated flavoprotein CzcO
MGLGSRSADAGVSADVDVLIIGAGFAGICMGMHLRRAGHESFLILEQGTDVGGTWRDNTYPGCACDVPSHLYSYSTECNPDWSRMYPTQVEIWDYLRACADKHRLGPVIRFNTEVREAVFDETAGFWRVGTAAGEAFTARIVVSGMGGLSRPEIPALPGLDRFEGPTFHSARWNSAFDPQGKRVAVVGTGASAIQFVPQIAPVVDRLHLFQRTPPWTLPKPDRAIRDWERTLFRWVPGYMRAFRNYLYWQQEVLGLGYTVNPKYMTLLRKWALSNLRKKVPDPVLRAKLTPDYLIGCKRILLTNDYLPALCRPNVEVVTDGIAEVRERSILGADGVEREVDAIIFGTGFRTMDLLSPVRFVGRDGVALNDLWDSKPRAYFGVTAAGFPNLFFLIGPNSRVANNSIVFMIEAQVTYVMKCLKLMRRSQAATIEVRADAQDLYNRRLADRAKRTVFATGCKSWYLDANGESPILWPGFSSEYWLKSRRVSTRDFDIAAAGAAGRLDAAPNGGSRDREPAVPAL